MAKTYADKLRSPKWQKYRLEIMQRDAFICQKCGDKETTLNVHHLKYSGENPWDAPAYDLITVCEDCHYAWEIQKKEQPDCNIFECLKVKHWSGTILFVYDEDGLHRYSKVDFKLFEPDMLKKIVHFIINCWAKHG